MNSFQEVFARVKQYCLEEGDIPEVAINLWINAMEPIALSGTDAVFTVQSDFQRSVILNNYEALLKEAFRNILGFDVNLIINVEDELLARNSNRTAPVNDFDELARRHEQLERTSKAPTTTIHSVPSSSAAPMNLRMLPAPQLPKSPAKHITRCLSTAHPAWAKPT